MEHLKKCSLIMYFSTEEYNMLNMYCSYSYIYFYYFGLVFHYHSFTGLIKFHIPFSPPSPYWFESYRAKYNDYLVLVFLRKCFWVALKRDTDLPPLSADYLSLNILFFLSRPTIIFIVTNTHWHSIKWLYFTVSCYLAFLCSFLS